LLPQFAIFPCTQAWSPAEHESDSFSPANCEFRFCASCAFFRRSFAASVRVGAASVPVDKRPKIRMIVVFANIVNWFRFVWKPRNLKTN